MTGPGKGAAFASEWRRFADAVTSETVIRLTEPGYSSSLAAHYNRSVAESNNWLLYGCDRTGRMQAFRLDLKKGQSTQLTNSPAGVDAYSLSILPGDKAIIYFSGAGIWTTTLAKLAERQLYSAAEGWERAPGLAITRDGRYAAFIERKNGRSRLRMLPTAGGQPQTVIETDFEAADAIPRPGTTQILYRQADAALWLVEADGRGPRKLELAPGCVGPAYFTQDGASLLYLSFPADATQPVALRELSLEPNTDSLVVNTNHYAQFGFNRDASVFLGASGSIASPAITLLLRVNMRERMLCEHRSSQPARTMPMFSPDAQWVFFQSDRHGKSALYAIRVDKLVEKTGEAE
jgi:oligogalacturonide lyase